MATFATEFSYKGSSITVCFCLQLLYSSCWPLEILNDGSELSGFLDEFRILEHQVERMKCDENFLPSYISLRERLMDFAIEDIPTHSFTSKIQSYLYNAAGIRKYNLQYNYESNLIVNITDHLDSVKKDFGYLRGSTDTRIKLEILDHYKEQYKLNIQDRMSESQNLVKNFIKPSLEKMEHDLSYKTHSLVAQMIELYESENEKEISNEKRQMLEKTLVQRELLKSFQLVGHVMSFLSGSIASAALNVGRGSTFFISMCSWKPSDVRGSMKYMEIGPSELRILNERIQSVPKPKNGPTEELDFNEFLNLEDFFQKELDKKKFTVEDEDSNQSNQNVQIVLMKLKKIIALGNSTYNIFRIFGNDSLELQPVGYFNNQKEKKLEVFKKYQNEIQDMVYKLISRIKFDNRDYFSKTESEAQKCSLGVSNWTVQIFLKISKMYLSKMTDSIEAEGDFSNLLEAFKETMMDLVENYNHIQNYLEQKLLFSEIEDFIERGIDDIKIRNWRLNRIVEQLESVIRSNIVLQRYRTAIDAFKKYVFPFASLYLHDLTPINLNDKDAMAKAVSQIEILQSRLKLYEQFVRNPSNYTAKKEFNGDYNYSTPFYVWNNSDHRSAIRHLLSGKEILLKADVYGSPIGIDAIKFENISLEFKTRNRNLQGNLTELLTNFRLRGVHLGNSYYWYNSNEYLITTISREFDFPFEMKGNTGDMMLSPYASWRFTLVKVTEEVDFEALATYVEEIDLELVGSGFYVILNEEHENGQYNQLNVDKYYKPVDKERALGPVVRSQC